MVRSCGGLSDRGGIARGGPLRRNAAKGPEYAGFRILDQMNDAREEVVAVLALPDVDNRRVGEHIPEDSQYPFAHVLFEGIEGLVDHHPTRLVQREAREGQALLIIIAQLPVPAR